MWKLCPRSPLCHSVTQPGNGTRSLHWSTMPRESQLACRYDHSCPSGPMSVSDSPSGSPTSNTSCTQWARPSQKSTMEGAIRPGVASEVAVGQGAKTGAGQRGVGVGEGVWVWVGVGVWVLVGVGVAEGVNVKV